MGFFVQTMRFFVSALNAALIKNADHLLSEIQTDVDIRWLGSVKIVKKNKYKTSHCVLFKYTRNSSQNLDKDISYISITLFNILSIWSTCSYLFSICCNHPKTFLRKRNVSLIITGVYLDPVK